MDRGERRRRTESVVRRRKRQWGIYTWGMEPQELKERPVSERRVGRMKKVSPFDCGVSHCGVCRKGRWAKGKTHQEILFDMHWREETNDEGR